MYCNYNHINVVSLWQSLKPVSHQSYNCLAVQFTAGVRPCSRLLTKLHTSIPFSLNVRQPYHARKIVMHSRTGLLSDVLAKLQDCRMCSRSTIMQTSWAVLWFVAFLRQPHNKMHVHCTVNVWQSCSICGWNAWVPALALVVPTPCVSYSSLVCIVAVVRPHKIARESQGKISFCHCRSRATLSFARQSWGVAHKAVGCRTKPEICLHRQVYSCSTIDKNQALAFASPKMPFSCPKHNL